MRTARDGRHRGARGPAGPLAVLGSALVLVAVALLVGGRGGAAATPGADAPAVDAPAVAVPTGARAEWHGRLPDRRSPAAGRPERLVVPALDVSAVVEPVSLDGTVLVPPADPQVLGWWRGGGLPGARRGTSVITGHTVHTGGGALDRLADLGRGDAVRVVTAAGVLEYTVRSVAVYAKADLAERARHLFSPAVPGRLALVTCDDWNGTEYESNVVVLAAPASRAR